ncbi:OprO/OprP family phosphate-selective porin [Rhodovarius crocodyli]|nr:porin [Rhodovarius crocodyli]
MAQTTGDGISWSGIRPQLNLADGNFTITPVARLDLHAGSYFDQDRDVSDRFSSGANVRRARVGVRGTILKDISYNFTWELAPSTPQDPSRGGRIFEASMSYTGIRGLRISAGAWTLPHTLAYASSSSEMMMLERPAIAAMATSLASGDTRLAVGAEAFNSRLYGAAFLTQGVLSTLHDDRQRGVVGRVAGLALDGFVKLQLGANFAYQDRPGSNNREAQRLRDYPELRLNSFRYLDTGTIPASSAWAVGPEVSGMIGRMHFAAEYQHIRINANTGGERNFNGWYIQTAIPLMGEPRTRNNSNATWRRGRSRDLDFNGNWGGLEAAFGYSYANLHDAPTRGGSQEIYTAALNWYPISNIKFTVQYQVGNIAQTTQNRGFQAISFGTILSF